MRFDLKKFVGACFVALCGLLPSGARAQAPAYSYVATPLGAFEAFGMNDVGQVVGGNGKAILWQNGSTVVLPTLGGGYASAKAINRYGKVVGGSSLLDGSTRAFIWDSAAGMTNLGTLGGNESRASAVNDAGEVVGVALTSTGLNRAFLWRNGVMTNLGTLSGGLGSVATGINASGQITGYSWDSFGSTRAFLWTPTVPNGAAGAMVALPRPYGGGYGISTTGNVAGFASDSSGYGSWPCFWDTTGARSLPYDISAIHPMYWYGYASQGAASAINDSNTVVGSVTYGFDFGDNGYYTEDRAFVWDSVMGTRQLDMLANQDNWFYSARAVNSAGEIVATTSGASYLLTPSPIPTRPGFLQASAGNAQVHLTWTGSWGADSYTVKRGPQGGPYTVLATGVTDLAYTDSAVVNGTMYGYVVSAVNSWGESSDSNATSARPIAVPAAPTGLAATAGDQMVHLSWNASAETDYYYVYRSTTSGGPYEIAAYTTDTYLDDYGSMWEGGSGPLLNGTTYYYVVTAVNATGESAFSIEAHATPTPPLPPAAPTGFTATGGDGTATLAWTGSAGANMYWVKRSLVSGGPYTRITNVYGTSYLDNNLQNGTTYYYVVSAANNGGESPDSSQAGATPQGPPPPAAPTRLTATADGKRKVSLTWVQSTSPGITGNRIYRSTTSGTGYVYLTSISAGTAYSDTSVTSKVKYYYVVTALASTKESVCSNQASATPK